MKEQELRDLVIEVFETDQTLRHNSIARIREYQKLFVAIANAKGLISDFNMQDIRCDSVNEKTQRRCLMFPSHLGDHQYVTV